MAMDRSTGKQITGRDEIEQSISEILGTQPGDRIMNAAYGADTLSLVDIPLDGSGKAKITQNTADAIRKWEPRMKITKVAFEAAADGTVIQTLHGTIVTTRESIIVRR